MTHEADQPERRRYRRIQAPVFVQVLGPFQQLLIRTKPAKVNDISLGGVRVYSDDQHKPGKRLTLELFFPDNSSLTVTAEVVWSQSLPEGAPARYDIGLRFINVSSADLERLGTVLSEE